ncbi:MAG: hypothetical protein PHN76_04390 [Advenella sp.]|jgi:hypothetical protein|uniref:hypothetical protein n=1 Tax=Advenella TaxID=290425 RepID=UPI00145D4CF6|nr:MULTISPECIES: hypothetical protein [Advenella]MDD3757382.1 hypothetical protein [Advenella sp.]NLN68363.1 hypothetical protein [Alcaligenaceae bacterium]WKU18688.1 hypothetical protein Q3V95_10315 [Advenella alkanexedens]
MKKTGLLAIGVLLAGCAIQDGISEPGSSVTRYMCNKTTAVAEGQDGMDTAVSEQTYPCTKEEFESMNKVYGSMEELKKSL